MASHTLDRALSEHPSPRVRLPDTTYVGGVRLQVSDLRRSLAYYREVLGLRVIDLAPDVATLGAPESDAPLVTLNAVPGTRPVPRRSTFGLFHFAILLPDRAALGRFVTHLASKGVPAGMSDHRVSESIYLTDPDGLGIEVYADRPQDTWRRVAGDFVMTTDPLDVPGLVSAGAAGTWNGAPAGSTMGHVHLHVSDLTRAAAFYREAVGFDVTVSNYPGATFFAAGTYHHHLGTNIWARGPAPAGDQARLLEWTLVVPSAAEARVVGERLVATGHPAVADGHDWTVADPWGTPLRLVGSHHAV
jgi:catechol 2,3-dioxygenase